MWGSSGSSISSSTQPSRGYTNCLHQGSPRAFTLHVASSEYSVFRNHSHPSIQERGNTHISSHFRFNFFFFSYLLLLKVFVMVMQINKVNHKPRLPDEPQIYLPLTFSFFSPQSLLHCEKKGATFTLPTLPF